MRKYFFVFAFALMTNILPVFAQTSDATKTQTAAPAEPAQQPPPTQVSHKNSRNAQTSRSIFEDEVKDAEGKDNDNFMAQFLNMLATLALIIILILIVTWILKRFLNTRIQQINQASPIKILERRGLTPKTSIYLIEVRGKHIIIAESVNGVTALGTIHDLPEPQPEEESPHKDFSKVLDDKMKSS